ncbi:MAG: divergent polysaccharide deacetylase family protein [Candidatus Omnitrophota bacterium]
MRLKDKKNIAIAVLAVIALFQFVLIISLWPRKAIIVKPPPKLPKVAIVIDDWGYNLTHIGLIRGLGLPLNLAILPNLSYSRQTAQIARDNDWQVILHLPMQPQELSLRLEKDTILTKMDENSIIRIFQKDTKSVPYIRGVSNHMGSRATQDIWVMSVIFKQLKKYNFYFLDSFVTVNSVCSRLAKKEGVRYTRRDVFLDNKEDSKYIKDMLEELIDVAKENGQAVGIGHNLKTTLQVLKEELPKFKDKGINLVLVSDLLK